MLTQSKFIIFFFLTMIFISACSPPIMPVSQSDSIRNISEKSYADDKKNIIILNDSWDPQIKRQEAAELFVKAINTSDKELKLKLLSNSKEILKSIEFRYPDSDIIYKVRNNIKRIDEEIKKTSERLI